MTTFAKVFIITAIGLALLAAHDRCVRCHRLLRDAKSKRLGIGPVCRRRRESDRRQASLFERNANTPKRRSA